MHVIVHFGTFGLEVLLSELEQFQNFAANNSLRVTYFLTILLTDPNNNPILTYLVCFEKVSLILHLLKIPVAIILTKISRRYFRLYIYFS